MPDYELVFKREFVKSFFSFKNYYSHKANGSKEKAKLFIQICNTYAK